MVLGTDRLVEMEKDPTTILKSQHGKLTRSRVFFLYTTPSYPAFIYKVVCEYMVVLSVGVMHASSCTWIDV
jgi:hypothetical protein